MAFRYSDLLVGVLLSNGCPDPSRPQCPAPSKPQCPEPSCAQASEAQTGSCVTELSGGLPLLREQLRLAI